MSFYYRQKNNIYKDEQNSQIPLKSKLISGKRAYMSASASLEASIIIPLFLFSVMSVMYLIQIISIQLNISQALYNTSRKLGNYAYACSLKDKNSGGDNSGAYRQAIENGIDLSLAKTMFLNEFDDGFFSSSHILGGKAGFNFLNSKIMDADNKIELAVIYAVKNPFDITGRQVFTFRQKTIVYAWLGRNPGQSYNSTNSKDLMVYITQNGSVFHRNAKCTYLVVAVDSVKLSEVDKIRNKDGGKYYLCEQCKKNISGAGLRDMVYKTDYGDRYHLNINCTRIKRTILSVPISSVSDRKPCSKCGKE